MATYSWEQKVCSMLTAFWSDRSLFTGWASRLAGVHWLLEIPLGTDHSNDCLIYEYEYE